MCLDSVTEKRHLRGKIPNAELVSLARLFREYLKLKLSACARGSNQTAVHSQCASPEPSVQKSFYGVTSSRLRNCELVHPENAPAVATRCNFLEPTMRLSREQTDLAVIHSHRKRTNQSVALGVGGASVQMDFCNTLSDCISGFNSPILFGESVIQTLLGNVK